MTKPQQLKSSVDEIRARFDADVERFSNLDTGQAATIDAPLAMELITQAAIMSTPDIRSVLDIGCGAGNNTLKLRLALGADFDADLLDLSEPMLVRAQQRLGAVNAGRIKTYQGDFRTLPLDEGSYDVVIAAAVLHHLRGDLEWEGCFSKIYNLLRPGGSVWITDLVMHESEAVHGMMWRRYGEYLDQMGGAEYRQRVFEYIDREDSPRPVTYQLELLRASGFRSVELLHKNSCFAAFGAIK